MCERALGWNGDFGNEPSGPLMAWPALLAGDSI